MYIASGSDYFREEKTCSICPQLRKVVKIKSDNLFSTRIQS